MVVVKNERQNDCDCGDAKKEQEEFEIKFAFRHGYELETAGGKDGDSSAGQSGRLRMS